MALYALTQSLTTILRTSDNAFIPNDPANLDWQAYQVWLATPGNVPDPLPIPTAAMTALVQLEANDGLMFRALEVLIDVLLAKGTIAATDFSPTVRNLYLARKALRVTANVP
jgi:hypothetical protein